MRLSRSPPIEKPLSDRMLCFKVDPLIVEGTDFPPLRRMETFFLFYFALSFFFFTFFSFFFIGVVASSALIMEREFNLLKDA